MKHVRLPCDADGVQFSRPSIWLNPEEYRKITAEINQAYETLYKGKPLAIHASFGLDGKAYIYWFENHGFDNYNIYMKALDIH